MELPTLLQIDFEGNFFKYPESFHFEYKKSISKENVNKTIETICAMLNRFGGYIIFGIKDDLNLIGLNNDFKEIDMFINQIDGIYHNSKILGVLHDDILESVVPNSITTNIYLNKSNSFYCFINIFF
jgi:predicted HTH transcriptional regulator